MNKKNVVFVFVFEILSFLSPLYAQNLKIGVQTGLGYYKMDDLKDLTKNFQVINPLNPKIVSNYPTYYYYQPEIVFVYSKASFGFLYSFQSTGSRISIKDYSGEYLFDTKIYGNSFGVFGEFYLNPENKLKLAFYSETGITFTKLDLFEFFEVNGTTLTNDKYKFNSKNYYIEPGFKLSYPIKFLSVEFNLGYFKQFGGNTLKDQDGNQIDDGGKSAKPDWSGWRYGLSLYFSFPLKHTEKPTTK